MIKYSILILIGAIILLLGMTSPFNNFFGPNRDPVPQPQKVAHSNHCAGCHGPDPTGKALVDAEGNDVNIHDDWQISMMALSAHDPFWRATLAHEVSLYPTARAEIETTCLRCHAPNGSFQSQHDGLAYSYAMMLQDSLGLDGVSCSSCHQQPARDLGKGHSGHFLMDTNRLMFGPYPNPFEGPMQIYVGFDPVFAEHIYSSGICAGCHTLITETLDDDGIPTGNSFVEQATYHEWLNSSFPAQGKECQSCHMPFIKDSVVIATDLQALEKRYPYGLHQFFGANTAMLTLMEANKEALNLPEASSPAAWTESIENNRLSLQKAAELQVISTWVNSDTLYVDLQVKNKSGHKLPTGYPSRVAWIQIALVDDAVQDTIYKNGFMDASGHIAGRDFPFEKHHEISYSAHDVQIYEMVMSDLHGQLTTRLNAAYEPLKDNRLLPQGFRRNHQVYDTVAIWGAALLDKDYDAQSTAGADLIQYRIPLEGRDGLGRLDIRLLYHTFPTRWMNDLFSNDGLPEVAAFKSMYAGYEDFAEEMNRISIDSIPLSTTSTGIINPSLIKLYPNPGIENNVWFQWPEQYFGHIAYQLVDIQGRVWKHGHLQSSIRLPDGMPSGIYYFVLMQNEKTIAVKAFTKM